MKTNMKLKGFTLIELLVVIVIIGILATISVATFAGYFAKARDVERKTFVANAKTMLLASQIAENTADYSLAGADLAAIETAVEAVLTAQGYSVPAAKNGYHYWLNLTAAPASVSSGFSFVICSEETADAEISAYGGSNTADLGTCSGATFTPTTAANSVQLSE